MPNIDKAVHLGLEGLGDLSLLVLVSRHGELRSRFFHFLHFLEERKGVDGVLLHGHFIDCDVFD